MIRLTIEALFNSISPGMCRLSPSRFVEVKAAVTRFMNNRKGANIRNTSKEQEQVHQNSNDEYGSVIPYPGSYDAVSASFDGTYYQWVKDTFQITEKKTETGIETEFYPGSYDAVTGSYVR